MKACQECQAAKETKGLWTRLLMGYAGMLCMGQMP